MPGYDRTGPWGQGSRTGGGFGYCRNQGQDADTATMTNGRGFGPGSRGLQRGFRRGSCFFGHGRSSVRYGPRWAVETVQPQTTEPGLQAEAADLRRRLEAIEQRLAGMEGSVTEPKEA
jgi:hypothetical protein